MWVCVCALRDLRTTRRRTALLRMRRSCMRGRRQLNGTYTEVSLYIFYGKKNRHYRYIDKKNHQLPFLVFFGCRSLFQYQTNLTNIWHALKVRYLLSIHNLSFEYPYSLYQTDCNIGRDIQRCLSKKYIVR